MGFKERSRLGGIRVQGEAAVLMEKLQQVLQKIWLRSAMKVATLSNRFSV